MIVRLWVGWMLATHPVDPLADALSQFNLGDFQGALTSAERGAAAEPQAPRRAQLELVQARCQLALRRQLEVEAALEHALTDDPALVVDASVVPPALVATLERLRLALAGELTVQTTPDGFAVRVDGALVGKSPVVERLPVGRHRVAVLDGGGAETQAQEVMISPRDKRTLHLDLSAPAPIAKAPPPAVKAVPASLPEPWGVVPAAAVHVAVDFRAGAAVEAGVVLLGTHWLAELDGVAGGSPGATVRAGGKIAPWQPWFGFQATVDGRLFFSPRVAPGIGLSVGAFLHPTAAVDVFAEASGVAVQAVAPYRSQYVLLDAGVRLHWPWAVEP